MRRLRLQPPLLPPLLPATLLQLPQCRYEEGTRIPMVYSNPKLWPTPKETDALVSHIDVSQHG